MTEPTEPTMHVIFQLPDGFTCHLMGTAEQCDRLFESVFEAATGLALEDIDIEDVGLGQESKPN